MEAKPLLQQRARLLRLQRHIQSSLALVKQSLRAVASTPPHWTTATAIDTQMVPLHSVESDKRTVAREMMSRGLSACYTRKYVGTRLVYQRNTSSRKE